MLSTRRHPAQDTAQAKPAPRSAGPLGPGSCLQGRREEEATGATAAIGGHAPWLPARPAWHTELSCRTSLCQETGETGGAGLCPRAPQPGARHSRARTGVAAPNAARRAWAAPGTGSGMLRRVPPHGCCGCQPAEACSHPTSLAGGQGKSWLGCVAQPWLKQTGSFSAGAGPPLPCPALQRGLDLDSPSPFLGGHGTASTRGSRPAGAGVSLAAWSPAVCSASSGYSAEASWA